MTTLQESHTSSHKRLWSHRKSTILCVLNVLSHVSPCQTDWTHISFPLPWTLGSDYFVSSIYSTLIPSYISSLVISFSFLCISLLHSQLILSSLRTREHGFNYFVISRASLVARDMGDIWYLSAKWIYWLALSCRKTWRMWESCLPGSMT